MKRFTIAFLFIAVAARAETADEIARHATEVMSRKSADRTCTLVRETRGSAGDKDEVSREELELTVKSGKQHEKLLRAWKDGNALSPAEMASDQQTKAVAAAHEKFKDGSSTNEASPFSPTGLAKHSFELIGNETLWDHPVHVLKVTAREKSDDTVSGTAWIDAKTYVMLKGEFAPAKLPTMMDSLNMQLQYSLDKDRAPQPTFLKMKGEAHLLWKQIHFEATQTWSGCH
jgi:hypothetical protein